MDDEFADIAAYYDELYVKPQQYEREAAKALTLIDSYKLSDGNALLDIACGTGGHIPYWREQYTVTGLDLSPAMLNRAILKFPDVEFHLGNMVDIVLGHNFDAVVCMYGSIGCVRTLNNLKKAVSNFAVHLKPGGILCLTPWSTQEEFKPKIVVDAVKQPHVCISRMENVKFKAPGLIEVDFHHLVGRNGKVTYHTQSMEIGLFSRQQYLDALGNARLELMEYYEGSDMPMGVFVARKSAE
ncbi:MAG TPA: class I SAM-dependent methyltransferase [Dehalococcoidia bacterium]|nr:class I SAM-dependent methyltransferase [Dehalococcoidia bacterium]